MNPYLERLRRGCARKQPVEELPKLPQPPATRFDSTQRPGPNANDTAPLPPLLELLKRMGDASGGGVRWERLEIAQGCDASAVWVVECADRGGLTLLVGATAFLPSPRQYPSAWPARWKEA